MRFDLFIIWGNGMKDLPGIMKMIRDAFEVVMIYKHKISHMESFIDDIYSCDSYPLSHLKEKTRYLLNTPQECFMVLVKNHHVDEEMVGAPPFRKPQCQYLCEVKSQIRGEYNQTVSHHVIHGTDYESQVHHILDVVGQGPLSKYTRQPHPDIPYPWHLAPVKSYKAKEFHPDALRINVLGKGLMKIIDSPHFKFMQGDQKPYEEYFRKYMGWALREDHFPEKFIEMAQKAAESMRMNVIYYDALLVNKHGHILDGGHRAAILKYHNVHTIKTLVL